MDGTIGPLWDASCVIISVEVTWWITWWNNYLLPRKHQRNPVDVALRGAYTEWSVIKEAGNLRMILYVDKLLWDGADPKISIRSLHFIP